MPYTFKGLWLGISDEYDEFSPNPFRNATDFLNAPNNQGVVGPQARGEMAAAMSPSNQPDPYSGLTGTLDISPIPLVHHRLLRRLPLAMRQDCDNYDTSEMFPVRFLRDPIFGIVSFHHHDVTVVATACLQQP